MTRGGDNGFHANGLDHLVWDGDLIQFIFTNIDKYNNSYYTDPTINFLACAYYRKQVNTLRLGHWLQVDMIVPLLRGIQLSFVSYSSTHTCTKACTSAHPHTRTLAPTNRYDYHAKCRCVSQKGTFTLIANMTGLRQSLGSYYKQFSSTERPPTRVVSAPYVDYTGLSKCLVMFSSLLYNVFSYDLDNDRCDNDNEDVDMTVAFCR